MAVRRLSRQSGVTLIEVTVAVAIFAVVIAISAQAIMSFYVAMDVQEDRVAAAHSCRVVLNALREKRGEFRGANETDMVNWTNFNSWINTQNTAGWSDYLVQQDGAPALANHSVNVVEVAVDSGPREYHVIATWNDAKGHTMSTRLVTRMNDR